MTKLLLQNRNKILILIVPVVLQTTGYFSCTMSAPEDHRRKWDRDEYEKLARARDSRPSSNRDGDEDGEPVKRELLKSREHKVDLDSRLGRSDFNAHDNAVIMIIMLSTMMLMLTIRSVVINKNTPQSATGGYYCKACDCVVKDSINYLDHINGKKHQRNLGMSMKVERSSLDQVKERFALNRKKVEEKKKDYDLEQRMADLKEEEERQKEYRKERRKERKRKADDDTGGEGAEGDADMMAMMGFSGFGSSGAKR